MKITLRDDVKEFEEFGIAYLEGFEKGLVNKKEAKEAKEAGKNA